MEAGKSKIKVLAELSLMRTLPDLQVAFPLCRNKELGGGNKDGEGEVPSSYKAFNPTVRVSLSFLL